MSETISNLALRDTERHILLAVDESENSRRAVMYVADFFGDYHDVFVNLISIIPEPSEDFFATDDERRQWIEGKEQEMGKTLDEYKEILLGAGVKEKKIDVKLIIRPCVSIGAAILEEQDKLRCCVVVVGRRGISHNEEFIFGSTSSKILHNATHCAVMVIE